MSHLYQMAVQAACNTLLNSPESETGKEKKRGGEVGIKIKAVFFHYCLGNSLKKPT